MSGTVSYNAHGFLLLDEDSLTPTSDEMSGIMHKKSKRKDDEHLISPSGSDIHGPPYGSLPFNVPHAVESKLATVQRHFKVHCSKTNSIMYKNMINNGIFVVLSYTFILSVMHLWDEPINERKYVT